MAWGLFATLIIGLIITHLILNVVYLILPESETVFVQSFELSYLMIFNIIVNIVLAPLIFKIFLFIDKIFIEN